MKGLELVAREEIDKKPIKNEKTILKKRTKMQTTQNK
jgi:hypothetical protein